MDERKLWAQADGLRATAETMIKTGHGNDVAQGSTRAAVKALVEAGKELKANNPVVAALEVRSGITWGEVPTIATAICNS